jgi:hypothetical protein
MIKFLFMPRYWIMNERYSEAHDIAINSLLDKYEFTNVDSYTAYLGEVEIWISNFPYSVGIRDLHGFSRPSRNTILRMANKLERSIIDKYQ